MAMRGPGSYRGGWGSDYSFEPINIFADKEKQRAGDLIKAASQQKYGTDMPPIPKGNFLTRATAGAFGQVRDAVANVGSMPPIPGASGGGALSSNPIEAQRQRWEQGRNGAGGSALGNVGHALNTLVSGRAFVKELTKGAVDTNDLPWGLRQAADVVAAPATLLTAGFGGAGAAAAKTGGQVTGKALAGSILSRLAQETAAGTAGYIAQEQVDKRLPENTPGVVRAGVGLATGVLAGGAAYKAIANPSAAAKVLKKPGSLEPLGATTTEAGGSPLKRTDLVTVPHDQITARPDLFQARDVPEGMATDPARVKSIVENFDPNKLEPGLLVHDSSTGKYVVLRGHHRAEAMAQLSGTGKLPATGKWEVIDANLSDPAHVAQLQEIATTSNYTTAATNIREDVRAYSTLRNAGHDAPAIEGKLRKTQQQVQDLDHLSTLPNDLLDRVNQSPTSAGNASEIAGAVRRYGLPETDMRALFGRYGPDAPQGGLARTELRRLLDQVGRVLQEENAKSAQGGFGGFGGGDWAATKSQALDAIDQMASLEKDLGLQRSRAASLDKKLADFSSDPEITNEVSAVRAKVQAKLQDIEQQLAQVRNDYNAAREQRFTGTTAGLAGRGVPGADVQADQPGVGAGGSEPTVKAPGLFGDVTDTGRTEAQINRPTQVDVPPPLPKPQETAIQQGFGGSVQELPGMSGAPDMAAAARRRAPAPGVATPKDIHDAVLEMFARGEKVIIPNAMRPVQISTKAQIAVSADGKSLLIRNGKAWSEIGSQETAALAKQMGLKTVWDDLADLPPEPPKPYDPTLDGETPTTPADVRPTATNPAEVRQPATGARGPEADPAIGPKSGIDTPAAAPPMPPKGPPPTTEPGPGNPQRGFGQTGETVDLLGSHDRQAMIDSATAGQQTRVGKFKQRVRARDPRVEAVRAVKTETDHIVRELPAEWTDTLRYDAEKAGLALEAGDNGWQYQGVSVSDIVEGRGDAAKAIAGKLTPEQKAVFDEVQRRNELVNKTGEAYGVDIPKTETETGGFWPRKVIGRVVEGKTIAKDKGGSGTGTRRLGADRIGKRTQASEAIGAEAGVVYDNPWDALRDSWKNKLLMAQDAKLAQMIEPLAVKEAKPGFGYNSLPGHPALTKKRVVGTGEGGAAVMIDEPMQFETPVRDQLRDIFEGKGIGDTKPGKAVQAINAVATPIRAGMDVSASLNQGLGLLESSPKNMAKAVKGQVQVVRSALGDPEKYAAIRRTEAARTTELLTKAGVSEANQSGWMVRMGKHYAGEGAVYEQQFPEWFQSSVGKVPGVGKGLEAGVRWSNETFGRYLNYARDILSNDALEKAVGQGLQGSALETEMKGAIKSVNRMTGWTNTKMTSLEGIAMFAPRFFRSNIEQVATAFTKGGLEGSVARAHLGKMVGIGAGLTIAVNEARGYNTDLDPRSTNFMRMRNIGGQDISPFGPFSTLIRGVAQSVGGQPGTMTGDARGHGFVVGTNMPVPDPYGAIAGSHGFARAKASPVVSAVWSLFSGSNYAGETFDASNPMGALKAVGSIGKESIPFSGQAVVQGLQTGSIKDALGAGATSALGVQGTAVTPAEKRGFEREAVTARLFPGKSYADLLGTDKAMVNQDPKVMKLDAAAQQNALTKDNAQSKTTQFNQDYRTAVTGAGTFLAAGKDASGKPYTGVEYRHAVQTAGEALRNQMKGAGASGGTDPVLDGWYGLYDKAKMEDASTNYDKLDVLQADYVAAHPDVQDKIAKSVGTKDDPTQQALRKAQAQAKQYYDIPKYRGLSTADGEKADTAIAQASALTSSGVTATRQAAYAKLIKEGKLSQEDALLAIRAPRLGTNPERKRFLADNPEFAVFYKGAPDGGAGAGTAVTASSSGGSKGLSLGSRGGSSSKASSKFRTAAGTRR
jgi:hypothetical protein